jgi:hypothetical protein
MGRESESEASVRHGANASGWCELGWQQPSAASPRQEPWNTRTNAEGHGLT